MTTDTGYAPDRWEFDEKVTSVFEDMLERSIPQYETMRDLSAWLAASFVRSNTTILDIGSSRGDNIRRIQQLTGMDQKFIGLEISEPMVQASRAEAKGNVVLLQHDLRNGIYDPTDSAYTEQVSVVCSILTLMFIPMEYRLSVLTNIYDLLPDGGCFILVEKLLGNNSLINHEMVNRYHEMKHENGYSWEDITRKKLSLEGVLVPQSMQANMLMLETTGFKSIDCFWRWMNFGGFIAIK
jgi:tRNA (cmo5U34)-methyltransferase